jgi:hypothetical protein
MLLASRHSVQLLRPGGRPHSTVGTPCIHRRGLRQQQACLPAQQRWRQQHWQQRERSPQLLSPCAAAAASAAAAAAAADAFFGDASAGATTISSSSHTSLQPPLDALARLCRSVCIGLAAAAAWAVLASAVTTSAAPWASLTLTASPGASSEARGAMLSYAGMCMHACIEGEPRRSNSLGEGCGSS